MRVIPDFVDRGVAFTLKTKNVSEHLTWNRSPDWRAKAVSTEVRVDDDSVNSEAGLASTNAL